LTQDSGRESSKGGKRGKLVKNTRVWTSLCSSGTGPKGGKKDESAGGRGTQTAMPENPPTVTRKRNQGGGGNCSFDCRHGFAVGAWRKTQNNGDNRDGYRLRNSQKKKLEQEGRGKLLTMGTASSQNGLLWAPRNIKMNNELGPIRRLETTPPPSLAAGERGEIQLACLSKEGETKIKKQKQGRVGGESLICRNGPVSGGGHNTKRESQGPDPRAERGKRGLPSLNQDRERVQTRTLKGKPTAFHLKGSRGRLERRQKRKCARETTSSVRYPSLADGTKP